LFADFTDVLGDFSAWPNLAAINPDAWQNSKINGRNYLFPRSRGYYNVAVAMIRTDWLEELGMEMPTTTDEFADYLIGVSKADLDGNGKVDTIGTTNAVNWIFPSAFGDGMRIPVYSDNGGIVHYYLTESYVGYLEYYRNLYAEGALAQEYALISGTQSAEMFYVGKSATYLKNMWHQVRLEDEVQKTDPDGKVGFIMSLKGPDGYAFNYDKGFFGGMTVSAAVSDEKLMRIVEFMDQTSAEENYNFCTFGLEGVHWNLVDGFPQLTEQGQTEVTNSFYSPYTLATNLWAKVDSPLATNEENLANREKSKALDTVAAEYVSPLNMFDVIISESWASFWSKVSAEFEAFEVDVISGAKTIEDFRAYQQELLSDPEVQASFLEYKASYEEFGFPEQ
jgi:putative aldouronate transport system substrate-binding protein